MTTGLGRTFQVKSSSGIKGGRLYDDVGMQLITIAVTPSMTCQSEARLKTKRSGPRTPRCRERKPGIRRSQHLDDRGQLVVSVALPLQRCCSIYSFSSDLKVALQCQYAKSVESHARQRSVLTILRPSSPAEIVHIVLWRLKKPGLLTSTSTEDALAQAKKAIGALKQVPGPEVMHLGAPMIDARAKGFDYGECVDRSDSAIVGQRKDGARFCRTDDERNILSQKGDSRKC